MRFLYMCDSHLSNKQPVNRLDDIIRANEDKFMRCTHIYNETKCDFTLHGGDLFNDYSPDIESVRIVLDYIERTGEFWLLPGNHDLPPGGNPTAFDKTLFSLIAQASNKIKIFSTSWKTDKVEIKPILFARRFGNLFMIPSEKDLLILVSHLLIDAKGYFTPVESIITNANLFLCSHTHFPYDLTVKKTRFYNPGALIRRRISEKEITPRVAVITIDIEKPSYKLKEYKLAAPRPKFRMIPKRIDTEEYNFSELINQINTTKDLLDLRSVMQEAYKITQIKDSEDITYIEKIIEETKNEQ